MWEVSATQPWLLSGEVTLTSSSFPQSLPLFPLLLQFFPFSHIIFLFTVCCPSCILYCGTIRAIIAPFVSSFFVDRYIFLFCPPLVFLPLYNFCIFCHPIPYLSIPGSFILLMWKIRQGSDSALLGCPGSRSGPVLGIQIRICSRTCKLTFINK